ncbi:MAG TPA: MG2 domain-containing protein, partial [Bryobacteraceae bacterium]|nr:MG2 domain-containing protein [Bryobacteraceae bacterium]
MRLTATLALVFCASASAEITVDENATRAKLVNNSTWVFLAIHNQFEKPVDTRVELEWLDPENTRRGRTQFAFTAKPGSSIAEAALPVNPTDDPLFFRLHYSVSADTRNLTAFSPIRGMISFPIIAEHGFRLTAAGIGVARLGQPYEFHVFASHPITLAPVADVQITLDDKPVARTGADGTAVVRLMLATDDWEYPDNITFHGRLGDLVQETEAWHPGVMPNDVRICTDKPLYQPGQTVHVRILALGSDGKARSGAEYGIEISDERSTTVHSADLKTSQYGIAHTDWEVPANAANGKYEIELEDKDAGITYQRYVEIRRYELPSFRVTVRLDRSYYLSGQNAIAEVRADYLFGKSLSAGSVRICAAENDTALHEGSLGLGGTFHATLDLAAAREDLGDARFADLHYVAYVTDAGTNRTEKRPFDVRISRAPIHIYVLSRDRAALWRPLYVMTYTPDGKPAASDVEALVDGQVLGSGKTNRFGLARLSIPPNTSGEITVRARASEGQATQTEQVWPGGLEVRLETDRVLYVAGQPVRCRITSPRHDLHATLLAWNRRGDVLFSKPLHLKKGSAEAVIPYDARFGREVTIEILSPLGDDYQTGRTILYPGAEDLQIIAAPGAGSYRPGDEATLTVRTASSSGSPARSALGVAVVDESVFERVAGDTANRRHGWFDSGYESRESKIGGFGITDLLNLDPARIDADLQLVAEALLDSQSVAPSGIGTFLELDRQTDYPATVAEFGRLLSEDGLRLDRLKDPWGSPVRVAISHFRDR